ncbi:transcriptional regulator [Actinoalloteichus sp. AHMU CJ021]|uniref:FMN-binding negative transcriptional regulator n=1 Tax=Actinoalloteichus sp. AHMU CJ021 TaxID=2072503 RepID=UPI000CA0261B|nr:transcriptional regulator [Actinoalloteichus sp. AHMU CJ021]
MFVPHQYRAADTRPLVELIRSFPLATLVSHADGALFATHVPVLLAADADAGRDVPDPADLTILGHLNRLNPHRDALAGGGACLLTFTGPHSYVSPAHYGRDTAAPTWNFTSVHVHGHLTPLDSTEDTRHVVRSTALLYERRFGAGWDMTGSLDYFEQLLPGVSAFRVDVGTVEGMFKLGQEQPGHARQGVLAAFTSPGAPPHQRAVAELMRRFPPDAAGGVPGCPAQSAARMFPPADAIRGEH